MKKNCLQCGKEFEKNESISVRSWNERTKFCSRKCMGLSMIGKPGRNTGNKNMVAWNKGKKLHYQVWNKGSGEYAKILGFGKWMLGKKQSIETRKKKSEAAKVVIARGEHNFYIDGRTTKNHTIRNSMEYKFWRESVFKRDDFTCQICNKRGVYLQADHIKPFAYFPELRFELSNGRTLCLDCHKGTDTYMGGALKYNLNYINARII